MTISCAQNAIIPILFLKPPNDAAAAVACKDAASGPLYIAMTQAATAIKSASPIAIPSRTTFANLRLPSSSPWIQRSLAVPHQTFRHRVFGPRERIRTDVGATLSRLMGGDRFADLMGLLPSGGIDGVVSATADVSRIRTSRFTHVVLSGWA